MGDDKKKKGGLQKKVGLVLGLVAAVWVGYFAYAKATHQEPTCLFTVICNKFK
jgi:hypothetical protein